MFNKIRKSLKIKIFLTLFFVNLAVILIVGGASYQSKRSALKEQVENNLIVMTTEQADKIDRFLNQRQSDTQAIALHYSFFRTKSTTSNQNEALARYLKIYPYYEKINIINLEDINMPAGKPGRPGGNNWYQEAFTGKTVSSDLMLSPLTDKPEMSFAAPVMDKEGKVVSVLTASLKLEYLWDIVDKVRKENEKNGLTGYAFIVNSKGVYIAHPSIDKVLHEAPIYSPNSVMANMIHSMTQGLTGTASYSYEGNYKVAAYAPCKGFGEYPGHGWSLAITKNYSEIYQPMRRLLDIYLGIIILTSIAVLFISRKLANYLVKPVVELKDAAAIIGGGNFNHRIDPPSEDEIGELAHSFNLMSETLKTRDTQIKEYTWNLTRINRELALKQEELARANDILRKANEELIRLEKQKAEFNAMITHDIKSPLATIITYAEMIADGTVQGREEQQSAIASISGSGQKILSLVENYLISSAIESGNFGLDLQPLDINEFVDEELPFFVPQCEKKKIGMITDKAERLPSVMADRMSLDRALTNIISNAIKFSPPDTNIVISTYAEGNGFVAISIRDNGRGIPKNEIEQVFNKYKRVRDTAHIDGQGLGLYIAKAICEAHGGKVSVTSVIGEGSTFILKIPARTTPEITPL
jgi:signal transduction histidine kinase